MLIFCLLEASMNRQNLMQYQGAGYCRRISCMRIEKQDIWIFSKLYLPIGLVWNHLLYSPVVFLPLFYRLRRVWHVQHPCHRVMLLNNAEHEWWVRFPRAVNWKMVWHKLWIGNVVREGRGCKIDFVYQSRYIYLQLVRFTWPIIITEKYESLMAKLPANAK